MGATIDLDRVSCFVAVAELSSFSAAGRKLGVPTSTVSRAVKAFEAGLGLQLFQRTTRHVSMTAEGATLFEQLGPALHAVTSALAAAPERDQPAGVLRVTASPDIGAVFLAPAIRRFTARYPLVTVDARLTSRPVDLIREGIDVAVRAAAGPLRDSTLIARKVFPAEVSFYSSPSYLARAGTPRAANDLAAHELVAFRGWNYPRDIAGAMRGAHVLCDDFSFVRAALLAGAGIGLLPPFLARDDVSAGALVPILPKLAQRGGSIFVMHARANQVPKRVSAFTEVLAGIFSAAAGPAR
jgi:DNA-binding transcriptional LysR family regulator